MYYPQVLWRYSHGKLRPPSVNLLFPYLKVYRIGEKYLEWPDAPLSSETILELVTLYWLTDTYPRAIYPYREVTPT
jgi:hypothetical protein